VLCSSYRSGPQQPSSRPFSLGASYLVSAVLLNYLVFSCHCILF
jgi:hypothetical protein